MDFTCDCGAIVHAEREHLGRRVRCQRCRGVFRLAAAREVASNGSLLRQRHANRHAARTALEAMLDSLRRTGVDADPVDDFACWLQDYLASYAEEVDRFPDLAGQPHWNLVGWDPDPTGPMGFVVAVFGAAKVSFVAGQGPAASVKAWAENEFPSSAGDVLADLEQRFDLAGPVLELTRASLDEWLGSLGQPDAGGGP